MYLPKEKTDAVINEMSPEKSLLSAKSWQGTPPFMHRIKQLKCLRASQYRWFCLVWRCSGINTECRIKYCPPAQINSIYHMYSKISSVKPCLIWNQKLKVESKVAFDFIIIVLESVGQFLTRGPILITQLSFGVAIPINY